MDKEKRDKLEYKEYKRQLREKAADEREAKTGMRQSSGAMIAKIIIGFLIMSYGFVAPEGDKWTVSHLILYFVIGIAIASWGIIPYLNAKAKREQKELKEVLSVPLQTFEDMELQKAKERVEKQEKIEQENKEKEEAKNNEVDELKRYKKMLDEGLITKKDYEAKKKQILGL